VIEHVIKFISDLVTVIALFGIFDLLLEEKTKRKLSLYIFGFHDLTFWEFENKLIKGLMKHFIIDSKISPKRVFLYSITVATVLYSIAIFYGHINNDKELNLSDIANPLVYVSIIFISIITYPLDLWSLWITKRLFVDINNSAKFWFIFVLIDLFLSALPALLIFGFISQNMNNNHAYMLILAIMGGVASFSIVMISFIQILSNVVGFIIRSILIFTRINSYTAMYTKAHDFPLTFIGFIIGVVVLLLSIIMG